jgi:hypothetical protein
LNGCVGDSTAPVKEKPKIKKNKSAATGWSLSKKFAVVTLVVGLVAVGISAIYPKSIGQPLSANFAVVGM